MTDARAPESPAVDPPPAATFEQATARLGKIVDELERGELSLERSLELFEEGVRLARVAEERITAAERRVEELLAVDPSGRPVIRKLDVGKEEP